MKAAIYIEPGRIELEDVPKPVVEDDGLLVRVRAASICGTDLKISRNGHFKLPAGQRRVLGHELSGDVVEVGHGQHAFAVGDRVSVAPNVGCGICRQCRAGAANMCPDYDAFGITLDGGFEEYLHIPGFAVHRGNVFWVPEGVGYAEAALVEPFSCCYRGQRQIDIGFEDVVLIMGLGPIGTFHLILAKLAGTRKVIVSDLAPARLEAAKAFGADVVVNVSDTDLAEVVRQETGGQGADAIITAVSAPALQSQAVDLLAINGRVNFFAGVPAGSQVPIDTNKIHYRSLTLSGTTGQSNGDYLASLRLVGDGKADLTPLVSRRFALGDIHEAFEYAASGAGFKTVIEFGAEEA
jgi:L-iditol 2-dehydrogenase